MLFCQEKIIALCADNTNANFGGLHRPIDVGLTTCSANCPMRVLKSFSWVILESVPTWSDIETTLVYMSSIFPESQLDESALFDEYGHLKAFMTVEKLQDWKSKYSVGERWKDFFVSLKQNNMNCKGLEAMVQYALTLPGTSAPVERVFSIINNYWSSDKTQIHLETIKSVLNLKMNVNLSCCQYYEYLKSNEDILKAIHSSQKYE